MNEKPWLYWFDRYRDDRDIYAAAYRPVSAIDRLDLLPVEEACARLRFEWEKIFIPGAQHIEILREWLRLARQASHERYPTLDAYHRSFDLERNEKSMPFPILCLTGLSGISKTSLVNTFGRMCALDGNGRYESASQSLSLRPVRIIEIEPLESVWDVLSDLANPIYSAAHKRPSLKDLRENVRQWLHSSGIGMLILDEMQFLNQSSAASTRTVQVIMTLARLGYPFAYVGNYSLIWKLMGRRHEERDRLLGTPIVLEPPRVDSDWWRKAIEGYIAISPEVFRLDASDCVGRLHRLTGGIFRVLRELLIQAYRVARDNGIAHVSMETVHAAYISRAFGNYRKNIEDLNSVSISGWKRDKRSDLVCPLNDDLVGTVEKKVNSPSVNASPPVEIADFLLASTLTPGQRKRLQELRESAKTPESSNVTEHVVKAKVSRSTQSQTPLEQALKEGSKLFRTEMKRSRKDNTAKPNLSIVTPED